jgi:hypothetical protein
MDDVEQNATEFVKMHVRRSFSSDSLASSGCVDIRFRGEFLTLPAHGNP